MAPAADHTGALDAQAIVVITCSALALYNAIELLVLIFTTFKQWSGLYFGSLLVAGFGIIPYNLGFLISYFHLTYDSVGYTLSTYGWITMITGQSVVLYSRLHFVTRNERIMKAVKWMIIVDAVVFHIPTTVMLFGSNLGHHTAPYLKVYKVYEKIQMTGFCIQEFIISGIYLWETMGLLKVLSKPSNRRTIQQLFIINIIIIALDIVLLSLEYRDLRVLEQTTKGVIYSIKLKFEFAILGKLVEVVESSGQAMARAMADTTDIRDPSMAETHRLHSTATILEKKISQSNSSQFAVEHRERAGSSALGSRPIDGIHKDFGGASEMQKIRETEREDLGSELVQEVSSVDIEYARYLRQMS
jgi:hypothetical protein